MARKMFYGRWTQQSVRAEQSEAGYQNILTHTRERNRRQYSLDVPPPSPEAALPLVAPPASSLCALAATGARRPAAWAPATATARSGAQRGPSIINTPPPTTCSNYNRAQIGGDRSENRRKRDMDKTVEVQEQRSNMQS